MPSRSFCRSGALLALALPAAAWAQCLPGWDVVIGTPGVAGGYAAPIYAWNSGSGESLYVGGSFTSIGGTAVNRYLARYIPATNTWAPLGNGISPGFTNAFMTSLVSFNPGAGPRLVAGGFYDAAGGVAQTASLAMWNGTTWEAMGTQWTGTTRGSIWSMAAWNGRLYVGGGVVNQPATIAGLPWAGFASWDGANWATHLASITGFSPTVFALEVFNDGGGEALYAGGRFGSLDNVAGTSLIGRWNGANWSSVGGGLTPTTATGGLEAATVFNDGTGSALYVAGSGFVPPGGAACNVARWNGQSWSAVGGLLGTGRITSMEVFDDGTGATLYIGGTAMPQFNYIARWQNPQWVPVGGGIAVPPVAPFPSVFGMGVWNNRLHIGGNFTEVGGFPVGGLAAWTSCATCYPDCNHSGSLTISDFTCFQNAWAGGIQYGDCNQSGTFTIADFACFQAAFANGCP